jgi:hypothetical protein
MVFKLDLGESENLTYSAKGSYAKKTLQPRDLAFFIHAQAGYGDFSKQLTHEIQHLPKKK